MNFIEHTLSYFGYTKAARVEKSPRWLSAYARHEHFYEPDPWHMEAQIDLATKVSWLMGAVDLVAEKAATTANSVKKRAGTGFKDIDNHGFETLLEKPNPLHSRHEFLQATFAWYIITGNCYWWLNRSQRNGVPVEIWIIPSRMIRPVPDGRMFVRHYAFDPGDGRELPIDAREICHFKTFNPHDMFTGMSVVRNLYNTSELDYQITKWDKNFFAKDNAKPSGILTFSSRTDRASWDKMKETVETEYGGSNRKLMMLQGVGEGAVNYVQTALSQTDMMLLDSRAFSRQEIYNRIAPGSASMLDVNATEANSKTGESIFLSIGVWPKLNMLAEKITNDILPVYGDGLVCQFDDIRPKDVELELKREDTYAKTHTIDEVRREFYNDDPIGDERGDMLTAEIGQSVPQDAPEDAPQEPDATELEPNELPDEVKLALSEISAELQQIKAQVSFQPTTVTINQSSSEGLQQQPQYKVAEPEQIAGPAEAEADLELWQKKAQNRARKGRSVDVSFESEHLSAWVKALVGLGLSRGDDIGKVFATAKMTLQLDPENGEAEREVRMSIEEESEESIAKALDKQRKAVVAAVGDGDEPEIPIVGTLRDALRKMLVLSADLGVATAVGQLDNIGLGFDWVSATTAAREWANDHAGELIGQVNDTTRKQVQQAVSEWVDNEEPLKALDDELERTFGQSRAKLIASTEVTNAYTEGTITSYMSTGLVDRPPRKKPTRDSHHQCRCWLSLMRKADGTWVYIWKTANDERVCPTCWPLHNTEQ
ncbi:MAG: phage portal protein [Chloroflexota bacterium]